MEVQSKILLVDDDPDNLKIVSRLLEREGYHVEAVDSGPKGIEALDVYQPDLVLLDVNMPGMDGLETIERLREKQNAAAVVFVTANSSTEDITRGLDAGALDYISKPFSGVELLARVRAQLRVKRLQDELREANNKLKGLVDIDDLTGLFNMRSVYDKLDKEIERARRYTHGVAAIMLDMDHFKRVNDNHDHLFGSFVLTQMGQVIRDNIRTHDFAARFGGDEFLICLSQTTTDGAKLFCDRLRKTIENYHFKNGQDEMRLTASMGCAIIVDGKSTMDGRSLVRHADHNLYKAKEGGRNQIQFSEHKDKELDIQELFEKKRA